MEARSMYPQGSSNVRSITPPYRVRPSYVEEEARMGASCPRDDTDPNDIGSPRLAAMIQSMLDGKPAASLAQPMASRTARDIASLLVREARSPTVNRNGKREAPTSLVRVVEQTGGASFNGFQFIMPAGSTLIAEAILNDTYRANRLIIQHPASDDGLMVGRFLVAGRDMWWNSGWKSADAFDRDTQCPISLDGNLAGPGVPLQFEFANSNGAGTPNLAFTAFVTGWFVDNGCY